MTSNTIPLSSPTDVGAYVSALINRAWRADGLHCWRLVVDVQRDLFGRALPGVMDVAPTGIEGRRLKPALFAGHAERVRWQDSDTPVHGAVVLMRRCHAPPRAIIHAGVFLALDGGGVLHCDYPQGVAFDDLVTLKAVRRWAPTFLVPKD